MKSIYKIFIFFLVMLSLIGGVNAVLTTGLKNYYNMGSTLDSLGNNNLVNSGATLTNGKLGNGYSFNGFSNYMSFTDVQGTTRSYNLWVKSSVTSNPDFKAILYNYQNPPNEVMMSIYGYDGSNVWAFYGNTAWGQTNIVSTNSWTMLTNVRTGSQTNFYVNGVLSKSLSTVSTTYNINTVIGKNGLGNSQYFSGILDEIGVWTKALTQAEINQLYNGSLGFSLFPEIIINPTIEFQNITLNNISNFNNSYYNTTSQLLNIELNTTDTNNNTNVTLYLYNSTNDLIITNQFITNNLTGSYNINFPYEDSFKFYMYVFNNETNVTSGNYTLTYDITPPNISLSFPTEINLNNQTINFSEFINVTEINNNTCSVSVTEFGQATQSFSNCFNTTFIFSNLGNTSINVTATDLAGNSNSEIGIININLYRINMSFTSGFSGLLLDQVSVNETTLGNLGSSGNNSYLIVYLNPNNYTLISSKTSYQPSTTNFTKSNISISENLPIILSATFSFTLEDERTLGPWNITPTTSVLLQVICTNQSVIQQSVNSTNFTIDVPCAINKFKFIINYPTDSYFRSILIDETQIQRDVYLIDLSTTTPVFNTFTIFDLSNNFINPRLSFRKFIPGQGDTEITGDFVNAQGLVPAYFILNDEYTIQLTSDNQPTRVIGFYSADAPGNQVLKLFSLDFTKSSTNIIGKVFSNMYISNSTVYGLYDDLTLATSTATFTVYNQTQFGNILFTSTILNANNASFSYNIPTILENTTLFTRMSVTNNIDTFVTDKILRQNNQLSLGLINFNIDLNWTITIFLAFLGLVLTISTASVGALFIVGLGGLFSSFGWYSVGWPIIALGALLAIVKITKEGEDIK